MNLAEFAARLDNAASALDATVVHAYGEVIGEEMLQDFEDHRDTGKLADTLNVAEQSGAVDFTSQHYRQYVGRFRRGIPKATLARARELAQERLHALLGSTSPKAARARAAAGFRAARAGRLRT